METPNNNYEIQLRLLGNEVFAIKFSSQHPSTKWLAIGFLAAAGVLTTLVLFGQQLFSLVK